MVLNKTLEEMIAKKVSIYCPYQTLYNNLSDADKKALDNAKEKGLSSNLIIKALRQEGYKISHDSIAAHAKGLCRCPK